MYVNNTYGGRHDKFRIMLRCIEIPDMIEYKTYNQLTILNKNIELLIKKMGKNMR